MQLGDEGREETRECFQDRERGGREQGGRNGGESLLGRVVEVKRAQASLQEVAMLGSRFPSWCIVLASCCPLRSRRTFPLSNAATSREHANAVLALTALG